MSSGGGRSRLTPRRWAGMAGVAFGVAALAGAAAVTRFFEHGDPTVVVVAAAVAGTGVGAWAWWRYVEGASAVGYDRGALAGGVTFVLVYPVTWLLAGVWPVVAGLPQFSPSVSAAVSTVAVSVLLALVSLVVTGPVLVPVGVLVGLSLVALEKRTHVAEDAPEQPA